MKIERHESKPILNVIKQYQFMVPENFRLGVIFQSSQLKYLSNIIQLIDHFG